MDDFSDVGESDLSATDDEQMPTQRVRDAGYWVQTVAAGRFYQRVGRGEWMRHVVADGEW